MKKYAYYDEENGGLTVCNFDPSGFTSNSIEVGPLITPNDLYWKGGAIKFRPSTQPTKYHAWNDEAEIWENQSLSHIDDIRADALGKMNDLTTQARARYVTDIKGQEVIYTMKRDEAERFMNDTAPDISTYPLIAAEIGITAPDAFQVAQVYLNLNTIFMQALAALERARLVAVAQIEGASAPEQIDAAVAAFEALFLLS